MSETQSDRVPAPRSTSADAALFSLERSVVRAILNQERVVVVTGDADSGKTRLLRSVAKSLARNAVRVVEVNSSARLPLGLRGILDQVADPGGPDGESDRVRRFCAALTQCRSGEKQVALLIDDADVLTPQAVDFVEMIAAAAEPRALPLHVVLFGRPQLWDLLSLGGGFGPHRITTQMSMPEEAPPRPEVAAAEEEGGHRDLALSRLWDVREETLPPPAPTGTALAIPPSVAAAEVFRFDRTPLWTAALSRTRATRWFALAALLAAFSTGALFGGFQFKPAATIAALIAGSGIAKITDPLLLRRESSPESIPQPARPAKAAAIPALAEAPSPATAVSATAGTVPKPPTQAAKTDDAIATAEATLPEEAAPGRTLKAEPPAAASTPPQPADLAAQARSPASKSASVEAASVAEAAPAVEAGPPEPPPAPEHPQSKPAPEPAKLAEAVIPATAASPLPDPPSADPPELLAMLLARGDALLKIGDVGGARMIFERAARSGSRDAAVAAGRTYDPSFLAGNRGIKSDKQTAAAWYRQALAQGDGKAAGFLARLEGAPGE